jgi:hypothetical protein
MDRSGFTDLHMMAMDGTNAPCVSLSLPPSRSFVRARSLVLLPTLRGIDETVCECVSVCECVCVCVCVCVRMRTVT